MLLSANFLLTNRKEMKGEESGRSSSNGLGLGDCSEDLGLYSDCDGKQLEIISKGMTLSKCFTKDHPD